MAARRAMAIDHRVTVIAHGLVAPAVRRRAMAHRRAAKVAWVVIAIAKDHQARRVKAKAAAVVPMVRGPAMVPSAASVLDGAAKAGPIVTATDLARHATAIVPIATSVPMVHPLVAPVRVPKAGAAMAPEANAERIAKTAAARRVIATTIAGHLDRIGTAMATTKAKKIRSKKRPFDLSR
jgi:hypothetical protein